MKKEYTLLMPMMMPIHFKLLGKTFELNGFTVDLLETTDPDIVTQGLRSVHNDTCYPALLVIGQLLNAIKSGKYDINKIGLLITQTGGGCRASNYIHLLRKALKQNGLDFIPVVSLNLSGFEKNPGFKLTLSMLVQMIYSVVYGDMIMWLSNQCRPYEINVGETDALIKIWEERLGNEYKNPINLRYKKVKDNVSLIVKDFAKIKRHDIYKKKIGIVGEIYVKYAPLGNNNLEDFLFDEGCEVIVPGLMDFVIFKCDNRVEDVGIYGGKWIKKKTLEFLSKLLSSVQRMEIKAIREHSDFREMSEFNDLKKLVKGYLGYGNKMGEGWLLTAEMVELCHMDINNIVCTQPFGCLPNHIVGKGMMRKIKQNYIKANIVAIDYDPGATRVNQENRIKLMLANAK